MARRAGPLPPPTAPTAPIGISGLQESMNDPNDNIIPLHRAQRADARRGTPAGARIQGTLLPLELTVESEPDTRWSALIWAHEAGQILGHALLPAQVQLDRAPRDAEERDALESARDALREALEALEEVPAEIIVSEASLVHVARVVCGDLPCTVGPSPAADMAAAALAAHLASGPPESLRVDGVDDEVLTEFVGAVQQLYQAKPWSALHPGLHLISIDAPGLGLEQGVCRIIGQHGISSGLLIFPNFETWRLFSFASAMEEEDERVELMPLHYGVSFDPTEVVPDVMREELRGFGWTASAEVWPSPALILPGGTVRACTTREFRLLSVVSASVAAYTCNPGRFAQPDGLHTLTIDSRIESEDEDADSLTAMRLHLPAVELRGAREQDSYGDSPPIAQLCIDYLQSRKSRVKPATVARDESVLDGLLSVITHLRTPPDVEWPAPAPMIFGADSLYDGVRAYIVLVLTNPRYSRPTLVRQALTVLRGFFAHLVREREMYRAAVDDILEPLRRHNDDIIRGLELAELLALEIARFHHLNPGAVPVSINESTTRWTSIEGEQFRIVKRCRRDRMWLEDPDGRASAPVRLPGFDFERFGLGPQWAIRTSLGRITTGKFKDSRVFMNISQICPRSVVE